MQWYEACQSPQTITSRYDEVPPLDPFPLEDVFLDPRMPELFISGFLSRLPDVPYVRTGELPDKALLYLSFHQIKELRISGYLTPRPGKLRIRKHSRKKVSFSYTSEMFRLKGVVRYASVSSVHVLATHDPDHASPRGPRLFGHRNVYNSCLLLLQELGYSLKALGSSRRAEHLPNLRWQATMPDGTDLSADTPIELLGLAALHRYHEPQINEPYWWRIEGPPLVTELVEKLNEPQGES